MINSKLDLVANKLESMGMSKMAAQLDIVSNTIDKFAGHKGPKRLLDSWVEKYDLEAKNWPKYVKKEIYTNIASAMTKAVPAVGHDPAVYQTLDPNKMDAKASSATKRVFAALSLKFPGTPEILDIDTNLSQFVESDKRNIEQRISIRTNDTGFVTSVPRDEERHEKQKDILKDQKDYNKEPVILIKHDKGYEIQEGNHRVIQRLEHNRAKGNKTFKLNAFVGIPKKPIKPNYLKEILLLDVKEIFDAIGKAIKGK